MGQVVQAASFEDFLEAPSRLAEQGGIPEPSLRPTSSTASPSPSRPHRSKATPKREKVGLTIDTALIEAVEDYIYRERKQGRRLKKNDVYEAALRQFLELEEDGTR